jgi:hypothetical protein
MWPSVLRSGSTNLKPALFAAVAERPACCRARCKCLWRALRQDLQLARTSTIARASNLQVSPLRMTIKPSCFGRDDSSGVVHSYTTLFVKTI